MQLRSYKPPKDVSNIFLGKSINLSELECATNGRLGYLASRNTAETKDPIPAELKHVFEGSPYAVAVIGHCYAKPENIGKGYKNRDCHEYGRRSIQIALRGQKAYTDAKGRFYPEKIGLEGHRRAFPFRLDPRGRIRYLILRHRIPDDEFWIKLERAQSNQLQLALRRLERYVADPMTPIVRGLRRGQWPAELDLECLRAPGTDEPPWEEESAYAELESDPPRYHGLYVEHVGEPRAAGQKAGPAADAPAQQPPLFPSEIGIAQEAILVHPGGDPGAPHNATGSLFPISHTATCEIAADAPDLQDPLQLEYEKLRNVVQLAQQEKGFSTDVYVECDLPFALAERVERWAYLHRQIAVVKQHELFLKNKGQKIRSWDKILKAALRWRWPFRSVEKTIVLSAVVLGTTARPLTDEKPPTPSKAPVGKGASLATAPDPDQGWHPSAAADPEWIALVAACGASESAQRLWLRPCEVQRLAVDRIQITAPTPLHRDRIRQDYLPLLQDVAAPAVLLVELSEALQ